MRAELDAGHSLVLGGIYGIGRTALVRHVACEMAHGWVFVFANLDQHPGYVWRELYAGLFPKAYARLHEGPPSVRWTRFRVLHQRPEDRRRHHAVVLDNVVRLPAPRLDLVRRLHETFQVIAIAEDFLPDSERVALCSALWVRRPLRLGHLSLAASLDFFDRSFCHHGLTADPGELQGLARAVRGFPLGMHEALAAELRRRGSPGLRTRGVRGGS